MKKTITLAALAVVSAGASASTNLIVDGSFEQITQISANNWSLVNQATLTADEGASGWKVKGATGSAVAGLEVRDNVAGAAESGVRYIELDGAENDKISQTLTTVAGKTYNVSFWFSDRTGVAGASEGWALTAGAYNAGIPGGGFNTSGGNQWQHFTGSFVASGSSTVFSLWGTGTSDGYGTSIDNISVTAAVPEPTTLGLFAAGLAVLGLSARRRKQQ
jgi:Protein of unknown function (DUF642)/PEP-CTERM motif